MGRLSSVDIIHSFNCSESPNISVHIAVLSDRYLFFLGESCSPF